MMVYSYTSLNDTQVCSYSALGRREKNLTQNKKALYTWLFMLFYVFIMYNKQIQYITPSDLFKTCIYHQVFVNVAGLLFGGQLSSVCQFLAAAMQQYVLCTVVVVVQQQMQYLHSQQWMAALKGAAGIQKKSGSQPRSGRVPRRRCRSNTTVPTSSSLRRRTPMYTYLYVRP